MDDGRVNLVVEREPRWVGVDLGACTAAVLVDAVDVVPRLAAEVQRLVRPVADSAGAGREDDLVRPGRVPADHPLMSSRAASSSDSRPSSSPFSFRRRSSASTSPTRGDSLSPSAARSLPVTSSRMSRRPRK